MYRYLLTSLLACCSIALPASVQAAGFENPLEVAAVPGATANRSTLQAVALAGTRIVAVGLRGVILYSDDEGQNWVQARVPVSTDLVALSFPTAEQGWAVGHEGVVIRTVDGCQNWEKVMDGLSAAKRSVDFYSRAPTDTTTLDREQQYFDDATGGAPAPFLDVYFEDKDHGFIIGTFNRLFRTVDGGKSWEPWMDRIENPQDFHLYGIKGFEGKVYVVGEQGKVWKLSNNHDRFESVPVPYNGSLFGVIVDRRSVLVYGMSGTLFRSVNEGLSWTKILNSDRSGVTADVGMRNGRIVLGNMLGRLLGCGDGGRFFRVGGK